MGANYQSGDFKSQVAITATTLFATAAAPQYLTGTAVRMSEVETGTLSALVVCDAEKETFTISAVWQVSDDNSTWYTVAPANNAATVVLATGTAGADATVTKVVDANGSVYGYKFARLRLVSGGTTADGTNDMGGAIYRWRAPLF
jgi:hypothetical protein